ncbi:MAG: tetratricopeptide repeat protein [Bacteroidetes bacterium]|jgi:tetratricopeptide (TPR) repeat protein|nr:tetratricopeptide repeat protein [Bacteroidota bacterium]
MTLNKLYFFFAFFIAAFGLKAQEDAENIYDGNKYYHSGKVPQSAEYYRNALKKNPSNAKAHFNLGNSIYKSAFEVRNSKENFIQGGKKVTPDSLANLMFGEAAQSFAQVANSVSNKDTLHQAWHNIGNCYMQQKEWQNAVDAYKKSLKFNPKDEETRYNLAYALKHIPKDKKGGGGSSNPKEEDKKDKDKNSGKKSDMNKDQAEQMLKALMHDEKKLQERRKQKQDDPSNTTVEKDW